MDAILCPTSPEPAFSLGAKADDPLAMYLADVFTVPASLAGLPAVSVPSGFSRDGLPIGMQLIGPVFSEETIFRAGRMFEKATGITRLSPPSAAARA